MRTSSPLRATSVAPLTSSASILQESATKLAKRVRDGDLSARELLELHIQRIEQVNPHINALVRQRFGPARREADRADQVLKQEGPEHVGPLHGVPCTIKESFALEGMPNSSGLLARRGVLSPADAVTVARIREAGAIPLGITNVPELCMWYETYNNVYGRTNNAYRTDRICGGSSGGEGAVVGAGGSPFGLGSDIGGSVRMPAFFNGVFGHKASGGMIPSSGQYPLPGEHAGRFLCTGPLCRRAEDLPLLVEILMGPDGEDLSCSEMELRPPQEVKISGLTVYVMEDNGFITPTQEIRDSIRQAAEHLRQQGATVKQLEMSGFERSFDIWGAMLGGHPRTGPTFSELLGEGQGISSARELRRWMTNRSAFTFPAIALTLMEKLTGVMHKRTKEAIELGLEMREDLSELLGSKGVLLSPTFPMVAPAHKAPLIRPFHFVYAAIFNVLEMPSTQIPLGLGEEGLPLGLQAVARSGSDHLGMAVALELERAFGGWVAPWDV